MIAELAARAFRAICKFGPQAEPCMVGGFIIQTKHRRLNPELTRRLFGPDYDRVDRDLIAKYIKPGDFILELGTGSGVTAMSAKRAGGASGAVKTVEADPDMYAIARENFRRNGLQIDIHFGAACVAPSAATVRFHRAKDFRASSIVPCRGLIEKIDVPVVRPLDLVEAGFNRYVLICDVEGDETKVLSDPGTIAKFDLIIVEIHNYGRPQQASALEIGSMMTRLYEHQFRVVESVGHSWVFLRQRVGI